MFALTRPAPLGRGQVPRAIPGRTPHCAVVLQISSVPAAGPAGGSVPTALQSGHAGMGALPGLARALLCPLLQQRPGGNGVRTRHGRELPQPGLCGCGVPPVDPIPCREPWAGAGQGSWLCPPTAHPPSPQCHGTKEFPYRPVPPPTVSQGTLPPSQPVLRGLPPPVCPQHLGPARRVSSRVPMAAASQAGGSATGTTTARMAPMRYGAGGGGLSAGTPTSLPACGSGATSPGSATGPPHVARQPQYLESRGLRACSWLQPRGRSLPRWGLSLLTSVPGLSAAERLHTPLRVRPVPVQERALHPHALAL